MIGGLVGMTALCVLAVLGGYFLVFGKVVAEVPIARLDDTTRKAVELRRGKLQLTLHARSWSQDDCDRMAVHVELLRKGAARIDVEGSGFDFSDTSGAWGSVAEVDSVEVPEDGLDEIRVTARVEPAGCKMEFEDLVLQVRAPRF
jgi:hypothetical protein